MRIVFGLPETSTLVDTMPRIARCRLPFAIFLVAAGIVGVARAQMTAMPPSGPPELCPAGPPPIILEGQVIHMDECPVVDPAGGAKSWQLMPTGLMYPAYLAASRQARLGAEYSREKKDGDYWNFTLGGKVGVLRYGTSDAILPQGVQVDIEAAAYPRLTAGSERDMLMTDFRAGVPITCRHGAWEAMFGYFHTSSHRGDDALVANPALVPVNYIRDELALGLAWRPFEDLRVYSEADWAMYTNGGAEPWIFQFGAELSSVRPSRVWGSPFLAVHWRIRQELDYSGALTAQTGWQWRGNTGHLMRFGFSYFNGYSDQGQLYNESEELFSLGLWYDY